MKLHSLYPLIFRPIYKDTFWGGNAFAEHFNRPHTPSPCAESLELCALDGCASVVANGAFEGRTLIELTQTFGRELVGTKAPSETTFPLLIKLVDVQRRSSVQVHPNATVAARLGVRAKHELWYVLKAAEKAELWAGVRPGHERLEGIVHALQRYETHPGDIFDIPPGLVHAVGGGNLMFEVQQSSDTAFRIDDWGNGRETHPEAALEAIDWAATAGVYPEPPPSSRALCPRVVTPHFSFATLDLHRERSLHTTTASFMILFCACGKASLEHHSPHSQTLLPGDLVLLPPQQYATLCPLAERTRLLLTSL